MVENEIVHEPLVRFIQLVFSSNQESNILSLIYMRKYSEL